MHSAECLAKSQYMAALLLYLFSRMGVFERESQYDRKPNFTSTSTCNLNVKILLVTETIGIFLMCS